MRHHSLLQKATQRPMKLDRLDLPLLDTEPRRMAPGTLQDLQDPAAGFDAGIVEAVKVANFAGAFGADQKLAKIRKIATTVSSLSVGDDSAPRLPTDMAGALTQLMALFEPTRQQLESLGRHDASIASAHAKVEDAFSLGFKAARFELQMLLFNEAIAAAKALASATFATVNPMSLLSVTLDGSFITASKRQAWFDDRLSDAALEFQDAHGRGLVRMDRGPDDVTLMRLVHPKTGSTEDRDLFFSTQQALFMAEDLKAQWHLKKELMSLPAPQSQRTR